MQILDTQLAGQEHPVRPTKGVQGLLSCSIMHPVLPCLHHTMAPPTQVHHPAQFAIRENHSGYLHIVQFNDLVATEI